MLRNKYTLLTCFVLLTFDISGNENILSLSEHDTVYISYSIAYFGEYGGVEEGIVIFKDAGALKARYVKYNSDTYNLSFSLDKPTIIKYFTIMKHDFLVIKEDWILDTAQIDFINKLIADLKTFIPKNGVSNASEFYFLSIKGCEYVIIDRLGSWDKYKSIHQSFNIQAIIPKRIYFLGIKLRSKEVKYKIE